MEEQKEKNTNQLEMEVEEELLEQPNVRESNKTTRIERVNRIILILSITFNFIFLIYIMKDNNLIIPVKNDNSAIPEGKVTKGDDIYVGKFINGVAVANTVTGNVVYGYIDRDGNIVIDFQFEYAAPFYEEDRAAIVKDGKWGIIDRDGNYILDPEDSEYIRMTTSFSTYEDENGEIHNAFEAEKNTDFYTYYLDMDGNVIAVEKE